MSDEYEDMPVLDVRKVLDSYRTSMELLRRYDEGAIDIPPGSAPEWRLTHHEAREVIETLCAWFPDDTLFGQERGDGLRSVIETIYQGFAGQELYPSTQEKAANLLYLVVKDHPLSDGNKRTAAALFVTFLSKNKALRSDDGTALISNNALAGVTLMVAMSDPKEKDLMIALITRMLNREQK